MRGQGKGWRVLAGVLIMLAMVGGCRKAKPVLRVYNWDDYIKPEIVERFER